MDLAEVDLNLLVVLDALLAERSVTRAAARVGLTQPAVSNALRRLRALVGDPLLVRTAKGLAPTPRALELAAPVRAALAQIAQALEAPARFDPAADERTFVIAASDYAGLVLLPALVAHLAARAPGVRLAVQPLAAKIPEDDLGAGRVDLVVSFASELPPALYQQTLFRDRLVCVVRAGHPGVPGAGLSLAQFTALPHVLVAPRGGHRGVVDAVLAERGVSRKVVVRVPHFVVAPFVVARTDCVATLAERVARACAAPLGLRIVAAPVELAEFAIAQIWHERTLRDPAHAWLRAAVLEVARGL